MIVVEENTDVGGHSTISGGVIHLGGGTSIRRSLESWTQPTRVTAKPILAGLHHEYRLEPLAT